VTNEVLEVDAVEEPAPETAADEQEVRPLPQRRSGAELDAWRAEIRVVAMAAASGIAAGAATVAAVTAVKARRERKRPTRLIRRGGKPENVRATRSFLIDIHLLDR
jgi:hypothetical protein